MYFCTEDIKKLLIRLDDIDLHLQRLRVCDEEDEDDFSMMEEIVGIRERLKKSLLKNETSYQRGDASTSISKRHNVVSTSKKGGNQGRKKW
jgi:hypothetical protein